MFLINEKISISLAKAHNSDDKIIICNNTRLVLPVYEEYKTLIIGHFSGTQNDVFVILIDDPKILELFQITGDLIKKYSIDPSYLGNSCFIMISEFIHKIEEKLPIIRSMDGESCKICAKFVPMAASNQTDGSFICYGCRC